VLLRNMYNDMYKTGGVSVMVPLANVSPARSDAESAWIRNDAVVSWPCRLHYSQMSLTDRKQRANEAVPGLDPRG